MPWDYKLYEHGEISGDARIHPNVRLGKGLYIGSNVVIYKDVTIGDGVAIYDGAVIGRPMHRPGQTPKYSPLWTFIRAGAIIGSNVTIYTGTDIGEHALIGDGVRIREDCVISEDCIVGSNTTLQRDVVMEPRSRVIDLSHLTNGVTLGADAFLSTGVLTMDDNSFNKNRAGDPSLRPPQIGEDVSIGGGAILNPGVNIGNRATVASGAVVTKDVAEGATVMGIPARERHDLSYDGTPGTYSHEQLGRKRISDE